MASLPQLTLRPESHVISTRFTNHDMANMRWLKPQRAALPAQHEKKKKKKSSRRRQQLSGHPLTLSLGNSVSKSLRKRSNRTRNPNICTKDTLPLEENNVGDNRDTLFGKQLFLARPSAPSLLMPSKWLQRVFLLKASAKVDSLPDPTFSPPVSPTRRRAHTRVCVNRTGSGLWRVTHVLEIHMATAEQQPYSEQQAPVIMSNWLRDSWFGVCICRQGLVLPVGAPNLNFQEPSARRVRGMRNCHLISAYCDHLFKTPL